MRIRTVEWACAAVLAAGAMAAEAAWRPSSLPNLSQLFGPTAIGHLPDGRFVYAQSGQFVRQDSFGSGAYSPYGGVPAGIDPSYIAVWNDALGSAGAGTFSASELFTFNPSSLPGPGFAGTGVVIQNYHAVFANAQALYVGGADTGPGNNRHGIRYVRLDGTVNQVVVDNVSLYSTGFDLDADGNLYVGDNDDGAIYRFTRSQLQGALAAGIPLTVAHGAFVHNFGGGGNIGSLAVDGLGRIWAAGFLHNGLKVYNPRLGLESTHVPGLDNANYKVAAFTRNGNSYISYINQANPFASDTPQFYGYDFAGNYGVRPTDADAAVDRDDRADLAVYHPGSGRWFFRGSRNGPLPPFQWGWEAAFPVPGDYDGDGLTDAAVYWPAQGTWFLRLSGGGTRQQQWGWSAARPVPADYDGDGLTDLAVYWPAQGTWYIRFSGGGSSEQHWGWSEATPVPADYDGDGKVDVAVYAPAQGAWYIRFSNGGHTVVNWGWSEARPAPADYDGDGIADLAVYWPDGGTWFVRRSSGGAAQFNWGYGGTVAVPADYDGDGIADPAVYGPGQGAWYVRGSTGQNAVFTWGWSAALPVTSAPALRSLFQP